MIEHVLSRFAFWCAVIPAVLFCWNLFYFRRPQGATTTGIANLPGISVLIPARNEESNIGPAIECVLASRDIRFELVVLDDGSADATATIIDEYARRDGRVRRVSAPPIVAGWAGKAHAAHVLSGLATYDIFCFIDADVRIGVDTLARMHGFMLQTESALVSGFPEEITVTPLEWLLLPLIQFLLLSYLPFAGLRYTSLAAFGAGCGQLQMMTREGYERTGGYASVRTTMHDGITLSKLFRQNGYHSDVADLTGLAKCRMYSNGGDVWQGLAKNATEGIAAPGRIVPFTVLLFCGQILPWLLLVYSLLIHSGRDLPWIALACAASLLPRLISIWRFRQKAAGAALHPVGVAVLLALQWSALFRKVRGRKATWKGRAFDVG
jgi:glycosyltransferase involved in cell wall biosynthesis